MSLSYLGCLVVWRFDIVSFITSSNIWVHNYMGSPSLPQNQLPKSKTVLKAAHKQGKQTAKPTHSWFCTTRPGAIQDAIMHRHHLYLFHCCQNYMLHAPDSCASWCAVYCDYGSLYGLHSIATGWGFGSPWGWISLSQHPRSWGPVTLPRAGLSSQPFDQTTHPEAVSPVNSCRFLHARAIWGPCFLGCCFSTVHGCCDPGAS